MSQSNSLSNERSPSSASDAASPSIPSSALPPGQPPIRMTDSTSGLNAPSLKFQSLSVQSYHLDSPPFTGTAGGAGGNGYGFDALEEAGREVGRGEESQRSGAPSSPLARARTQSTENGTLGYAQSGSSSKRGQGSASRGVSNGPSANGDVPSLNLDSRRESAGKTRPSYSGGRTVSGQSIPARPLYTQLADDTDTMHAGNGFEPDQEVDGDGSGYVIPSGESIDLDRMVPVQSQEKSDYSFPRHRLPLQMKDESKIPLIIVACGSFSPPTYLHLRIFEMAKDQVKESGKYELLGGYYSPVSDLYRKAGLAPAKHRVRMCELAVEKTSTWLMVDAWESLQDEYQRTAVVLDHFNEEINGPTKVAAEAHGNGTPPQPERGVMLSDGRRRRVKIMLLAGGDLIQSMGEPGVWADADLHHILGRYGCMIVERTGADVWSFLLSHDLLWRYRRNLKVVKQTIYNDISSSKVRLFVRRGQSIKYLLPNSVIKYIEMNKLYRLPPGEEEEEDRFIPPPEDENW